MPLGKTTTFTGLPGEGKSLAVCSIVAAVTAGKPFPDGSENSLPLGDVLILSTEDDPASILVPRLEAAGADTKRVHIIKSALAGTQEKQVALDQDRDAIQTIFRDYPDIRLFAIDPVTDHLGTKSLINEQEIRALLRSIESANVTNLIISHLNKKAGLGAQQRVMGAAAFTGLARAAFLFAQDEKKEHHMLMLKANYAKPSGLRYAIETVGVEIESVNVQVPCIEWGGKSNADADSLLDKQRPAKKSALLIAVEFLQALLKAGPRPATECERAATVKNISKRTLDRAKSQLGIESKKDGPANEQGEPTWMWHMAQPFIQAAGL